MTDEGHKATDDLIAELEARLYEEYKHAAEDIQRKLLDFWNAFERKDEGMKQLVDWHHKNLKEMPDEWNGASAGDRKTSHKSGVERPAGLLLHFNSSILVVIIRRGT